MLIDVHCHLEMLNEELDDVIKKSKEMIIVTAGTNPETNDFALNLAKTNKNIKCTLGIYPYTVLMQELKEFGHKTGYKDFDPEKEIKRIEKLAKENPDLVYGFGEIGLDYTKTNETDEERKRQKKIFIKQLELAARLKKPAIIHTRKAEEDVINILEGVKSKKVVLHCFSGSKNLVKRAVKNGWYFSITANIERSSQMQMIVNETPLSQLLTETDSPFLGPKRDERNEPFNVRIAVKKIAEIKRITEEETEKIIFKNFMDLK